MFPGQPPVTVANITRRPEALLVRLPNSGTRTSPPTSHILVQFDGGAWSEVAILPGYGVVQLAFASSCHTDECCAKRTLLSCHVCGLRLRRSDYVDHLFPELEPNTAHTIACRWELRGPGGG